MRMDLSLNKASQKKLEAALKKITLRVHEKSKVKMKQNAQAIMEESKAEVPVDTGTLLSTAFVGETDDNEDGFGISFGYDGNALNPKNRTMAVRYMVQVHEDLTVHHEIGKAKFLEDPVRRNESKLLRDIALAVKESVK